MNLLQLQLLLLILIANGTPVIIHYILHPRFDWPVDAGRYFFDGQRVLGDSKTWRGLCASIIVTSFCSFLLGGGWLIGALIACAAMLGDLLSSFIKRRLRLPSSSMAPVLDQLPESLLPALLVMQNFDLGLMQLIYLLLLFFILEILLSKLLYRLGIRGQPY